MTESEAVAEAEPPTCRNDIWLARLSIEFEKGYAFLFRLLEGRVVITTPGLQKALDLIDQDPALRMRLLRDPKGTVLYELPRLLYESYAMFTVDDELELVAMAEAGSVPGG
jgi:hypothetical protein